MSEKLFTVEEVELLSKNKYVKNVIIKYKFKCMTTHLCEIAGVLRSGYYNYLSNKSESKRNIRILKDEESRNNIQKAFDFKNYQKGARQIKMVLENEFDIIYNLKSIRRIMKKFNIVCTIRKANPYRRMMKATKEHTVVPNLLNREFKQNIPGKILLTDITYLNYSNSRRAYLSTIKDASTNEILAYKVSNNFKIYIVLDTLDILAANRDINIPSGAFILLG